MSDAEEARGARALLLKSDTLLLSRVEVLRHQVRDAPGSPSLARNTEHPVVSWLPT